MLLPLETDQDLLKALEDIQNVTAKAEGVLLGLAFDLNESKPVTKEKVMELLKKLENVLHMDLACQKYVKEKILK